MFKSKQSAILYLLARDLPKTICKALFSYCCFHIQIENPVLGVLDFLCFTIDTKESAYIHALSAASFAQIVSRSCLEGRLDDCTCLDSKPHLSLPSEMVNEKNLTSVDKKLGCRGITKLGENFARSFTMAGLRRKPRNDAQRKQIVTREHNINVGLKVRDIYFFCKMRVN